MKGAPSREPISPWAGGIRVSRVNPRDERIVHPSRAAVNLPFGKRKIVLFNHNNLLVAMNSGSQINDHLIGLISASPFRPFTLSLWQSS
jgi:hypothetical protein